MDYELLAGVYPPQQFHDDTGLDDYKVYTGDVRERTAILNRLADAIDEEQDQEGTKDHDKKQSAKRLQLLWDIDRLVNDPATTDDEKWDAIRALLDTNQLLLQIGAADEADECDFCGWFDGKHSPTCKVNWGQVPKCYEM